MPINFARMDGAGNNNVQCVGSRRDVSYLLFYLVKHRVTCFCRQMRTYLSLYVNSGVLNRVWMPRNKISRK